MKKFIKRMVIFIYSFSLKFPSLYTLIIKIVKYVVPADIRERLKRVIHTGIDPAQKLGKTSGVVSLASVDFVEETDLTYKILRLLEIKNRDNSH